MFESYIKLAKQQILEKYNKSTPFVYLRDIMEQENLDLFYKGYLTAEVNWWIYEEQMQRKSNLNFALDEKQFANLLQDLDNLYFDNARFDLAGLRTAIDSAVKIKLNFALRPRTTLKWFVFRGEPTKSFNEIQLRLDYFAEDRNLIDEFIKKIENEQIINKSKDIISVIEFERMLESIDNETIYNLSPEDFAELTNPIFSFFNLKDSSLKKGEVPCEALIIFLDDKGLFPLSNKLKSLYDEKDLRFLNKKEFLRFLYEVIEENDSDLSIEMPPVSNIEETLSHSLKPAISSYDFILPEAGEGKLDDIINEEYQMEADSDAELKEPAGSEKFVD